MVKRSVSPRKRTDADKRNMWLPLVTSQKHSVLSTGDYERYIILNVQIKMYNEVILTRFYGEIIIKLFTE